MNRKPKNAQPIVFYRPAWQISTHKRCAPHTQARRQCFRQDIWRLPPPPPADIKAQLETTIAEMKGEV